MNVCPVPIETDAEKQARIARRIQELLREFKRLGVESRDEIAHTVGTSRQTIWRQAKQDTEPQQTLVTALEWHLERLRERLAAQGKLPEGEPMPAAVPLPILGIVNAGHLVTQEQQDLGTIAVERKLVPRGRGYVLQVEGDSMAPAYRSGDLVVVNRDAEPHVRDVVVVDVPGHGTVLRRLVMSRGKTRLEADSRGYEPLPFDDEEIVRQGVVVGFLGSARNG